jgi:hypothetical protein
MGKADTTNAQSLQELSKTEDSTINMKEKSEEKDQNQISIKPITHLPIPNNGKKIRNQIEGVRSRIESSQRKSRKIFKAVFQFDITTKIRNNSLLRNSKNLGRLNLSRSRNQEFSTS